MGGYVARQARCCCRRRVQREVREALLNKVPACLQESEFPCWRWKEYDKAFACVSTQNPPQPTPEPPCMAPTTVERCPMALNPDLPAWALLLAHALMPYASMSF